MAVFIPGQLPDNLAASHAVILQQAEVIAQLLARVNERSARIEELSARNERLNRDLAAVKRQLFGSRRERLWLAGKADPGEDDAALPRRKTKTRRPWRNRASQRRHPRHRERRRGRQKRTYRCLDSPRKSSASFG